MIPKNASLRASVELALQMRIAELQREQQLKFLKKFCLELRSPTNFSRNCKSKQNCVLSALSSNFFKTKFSSLKDHLGSLIFSPEIPKWISYCGNESHRYSPMGYFLDSMPIVSEMPVSRKPQIYFKSTRVNYYIVDSQSFDFLTCNSMERKIVYTMFVQYFDSYVWLSLIFSIISLTALIQMKQKNHWDDLLLVFVGILLNISTCIEKVISGKKWSFVHWVLFIWFFAAFLLNNFYQIVVISNFIKPASVTSPWDHIFSLNGFSVVTPLSENSLDVENLKNLTVFTSKETAIRVLYTYKSIAIKYVYNGTILYESAKNHSNAVLAWVYSAFGRRMWSMFGKMCAAQWRGTNLGDNSGNYNYNCEEKSEMMASLDPVQMYDWKTIYTKLKQCDKKVAYVSESTEIIEFKRKLNKPGRPKMFRSSNQKELSQLIFWSFLVASKNDDDIHLKRLKSLVEFGLYRYLKKLTINSTKIKFLGQYQKHGEFIPLNLESNIASLFYMYFFFLIVIFVAAVLSYLVSTFFCPIQLTSKSSSHIFPIRVLKSNLVFRSK